MGENFFSFKEQLVSIEKNINSSNFKDIKGDLIQLRKETHSIDMSYDQKKELNDLFDKSFDKVNNLYEQEKAEFEQESVINQQYLTPKVEEAFLNAQLAKFEEIKQAWDFCIEVQQEFKGKRMSKENREVLYSKLQEAFDILKEKRSQKQTEQTKKSEVIKEDLLPEIKKLVDRAEDSEDISELWDKLITYQQKVREADLSYEIRNQLLDILQEGFTILKIRREEDKQVFESEAKDNVDSLEILVEEGEELASNSENFKETFERLKQIQQAFKAYKLLKEDRDILYQRLQNAFEIIKQRQNDYFDALNKESIDNYKRLKPMVENAYERAQTSMEFKKTKEHLKRVQAEFKGIKMKASDREELYSKLQNSFDVLHKRQDEYYAAKKDKIELHVNYQISDVDLKIEALKNDIEKDIASISSLSESEENLLIDEVSSDPSRDINNHIKILKAAIAKKEEELKDLFEMRESLLVKKEKWEGIE